MNTKQRYFSDRSIIVMLALLSAFPPLSTDLYLPALPHVVKTLQSNQTLVNLSLSLFLISFALGILVWGPVSEKYGRKPILLIGLTLYTLGSAGCALSGNVTMLIIARVVQGFGGGAAEAVVTAMVKDLYSGRKRESVLAIVMAMVVVAPVVAPVAGAIILKVMSWYAIFWVLTGVGVLSLCLSLLLDETLETRYGGSLTHSLARLGVVLKNPGFAVPLILFSLVPLPLLAFIGASAYVYIQGFEMSEQMYSYYFGLNALGSLVGPLLYIKLSRRISSAHIISGCLALLTVSGICIEATGDSSPVMFALPMLTATVAISMMRPPTANLLLSQQDKDTGSAASLINFMALFMGSVGMFLISFETQSELIPSLGLMQLTVGIVCGSLWLLLRERSFIRQPA
ncbi:membrane protein, major facilitator superfamily [Syntrophotalea carbinolica DSM 2380]|uniref:Membrane protein, major facilitator superfamily n=1 Tax=Syntrophotalea carbinolica (strain DSM 2380 / NBRC 103641 / GraBd1) TaxID=338963 RepID=Q3A6G5_SYNC1|nr:multidrug effflux MFS transporter [Syntrophotalea carbinolica]ABA88042.1 membrane protein, major facilitator superfamily [Syntrophotalea carbinolica DSM 2380]